MQETTVVKARRVVTKRLAQSPPMIVLWGSGLIQNDNDGSRVVKGDKHNKG